MIREEQEEMDRYLGEEIMKESELVHLKKRVGELMREGSQFDEGYERKKALLEEIETQIKLICYETDTYSQDG